MKLKKLLSVATLFVAGALGFNANAQQTPEVGKTYYLYNPTTERFLSRGSGYGTAAWADNFGIPVTLIANGEGFRLQMFDAPNQYVSDAYWSYVDGDESRAQTYIPQIQDEANKIYKLINTAHGANNYGLYINKGANGGGGIQQYQIASNADGTNHDPGWDLWQFLSSEEREKIVANKKAKAESACANAIGYELDLKSLKDLVSDVNAFTATDKTSSINNPTVTNSKDGWTYDKAGWGGDPGVMTGNGLEVFQGAGIFTQTVTGLAAGLYKVTVNGFYRDGSNADCSAKSNDGWKLSNAYLEANGNQTMLADWASDRASDHVPNGPAEAKNLFNNGKYLNEVFAIVGDDGKLEINLAQPGGAVGSRWLFFSNFTLTYYSDKVSDDAANSLIASMPTGKMNKDVKAEMDAAKNVFEADKTIANYNVLSEAINAANASITAYANAKAYFESAETILQNTNVYTAEAYGKYFTEPSGKYENGTLTTEEAASFVKHSTGWHSSNTIDDILLSAWTIGGGQAKDYDKALYINTWSVEGNSDGSEFLAPFFEYWGDDKLSLATTDIQAKVTGLEPSTTYSFTIRARVRQTNDKTKIENGITMKVGDGEAVDISSGAKFKDTQFYIGNFTAVGETDAEGTLTATITVADGCNVSWLSFRDAEYEEVTAANMTITGAGWATFIAPFEVEIPEGVTAYTVAGVKANNYLNKTALETVIPANTPVLLEGAAMTETFYGLSTATQNTYGEVLVGNVSGKTMNVSAGSYVLLNQNDKLGFYQVKSDEDNVTVGNNRCYLNVPAGGEVKAFFFDDEATGINGVETLTDGTVESIFTISGTRVNSLQKGLNIVKMSNGKTQKVLVK